MDGYTVLAGALIFFGLFIYFTWFIASIKVASQEEEKQADCREPRARCGATAGASQAEQAP